MTQPDDITEAVVHQSDRAPGVRLLFSGIAGKYDAMNRLMTFGRDQAWRRYVIRRAGIPPGGRLLDIGAGTGDISLAAKKKDASLAVVAADFTTAMMRMGRSRPGGETLFWCAADAHHLSFPEAMFDAVTSGYLMRNVTDMPGAFKEQVRVLKPGGSVVCLDTSPPPKGPFRPLIVFYLKYVIPLLGKWIAGNRDAYTYLPDSTRAFKNPEELRDIMRVAGLRDVSYRRFMFGTIVVLDGKRPG